jgi:hypothetical protein
VTNCLLGLIHSHQRLESKKNEENYTTSNRHGKIPGVGWKLKFKLQEFNFPRQVLQCDNQQLYNKTT